ncbi:hypothetical protein AB4144_36835, partial [Rhizobiaceae sp. 2RAB30]
MTFHSRSVVEFGLFYSRVSESLMSGAPLEKTAELVRVQLGASAVAVQIENRWSTDHAQTIVVDNGIRSGEPSRRLAELL